MTWSYTLGRACVTVTALLLTTAGAHASGEKAGAAASSARMVQDTAAMLESWHVGGLIGLGFLAVTLILGSIAAFRQTGGLSS